MIDKTKRIECYLYQTAGTKWVFGPKGGTKLIRHMKFFEDLVTGCSYPNQCVVRALMGVDYIPSFSGEKCLDKRYKREIQELEVDLIANIKAAEKEYLFDEARGYKEQLDVIRRCLKNDFIARARNSDACDSLPILTGNVIKSLYKGEILLSFTNLVRQRKLRALKGLREKEGFPEQAADLGRSFDVSNRNIVFLKDASAFKWILKPDE